MQGFIYSQTTGKSVLPKWPRAANLFISGIYLAAAHALYGVLL